ncbi:hypothetical protein NFI96_007306 [Prochilodus magdalenae]|nr:hypothetical protein NFI96_007306 [Prochilodus magdalenae]
MAREGRGKQGSTKRRSSGEDPDSSGGKKRRTTVKEERGGSHARVATAPSRKGVSQSSAGGKGVKGAAAGKKPAANKAHQESVREGSGGSGRASGVERNHRGQLVFEDHPEFQPNMSPKEVLQAGSFGGTYFRPIYSSITKQSYKDVWKELPQDWLQGLDIPKQPCRGEKPRYPRLPSLPEEQAGALIPAS